MRPQYLLCWAWVTVLIWAAPNNVTMEAGNVTADMTLQRDPLIPQGLLIDVQVVPRTNMPIRFFGDAIIYTMGHLLIDNGLLPAPQKASYQDKACPKSAKISFQTLNAHTLNLDYMVALYSSLVDTQGNAGVTVKLRRRTTGGGYVPLGDLRILGNPQQLQSMSGIRGNSTNLERADSNKTDGRAIMVNDSFLDTSIPKASSIPISARSPQKPQLADNSSSSSSSDLALDASITKAFTPSSLLNSTSNLSSASYSFDFKYTQRSAPIGLRATFRLLARSLLQMGYHDPNAVMRTSDFKITDVTEGLTVKFLSGSLPRVIHIFEAHFAIQYLSLQIYQRKEILPCQVDVYAPITSRGQYPLSKDLYVGSVSFSKSKSAVGDGGNGNGDEGGNGDDTALAS